MLHPELVHVAEAHPLSLRQPLLADDYLKEGLQPQPGLVRAVVVDEPLPGMEPPLELGAAQLLDGGPEVVDVGEEDARLVVHVLPAAHDVVVHQQRHAQAQCLGGHAGGRVGDVGGEQPATPLQELEEVPPKLCAAPHKRLVI
eukprot:scaffold131521_cov41-Prasinocladus_malaysianus.AAC.1